VLTDLGLLLTFGAVFPPLAAALAATVFVTVFLAKLKVGRFLHSAVSLQALCFVDVIEKECEGVGSVSVLRNSMWMLITISCCFYTLFLFDTLGDAVGFRGAYWVLIVMPLMPGIIYACFTVLRKILFLGHNSITESLNTRDLQHIGDIELQDVAN
jgi:hypothetical protein